MNINIGSNLPSTSKNEVDVTCRKALTTSWAQIGVCGSLPLPYLVIYSLSPGDDRLGTEDIQLETCNYLAAVSNIVSQQFLVSTNLKHHRHSSSVLKCDNPRVLTHFTLNGHIPVMSGHVLLFIR